MRRLLLIPLFLLALLPAPTPAHALGTGSVSVAPTAIAGCPAFSGYCFVTAREFDLNNRGRVLTVSYRTDVGAWTYSSDTLPFSIAGNESEDIPGHSWAVDSGGFLQCTNPGQGWLNSGVRVFEVDARMATPAPADGDNPGAPYGVAAIRPVQIGSHHVYLFQTTAGLICAPSPTFTDTGGLSDHSVSLAYMSNGAHIVATGLNNHVYNYTAQTSIWEDIGGSTSETPAGVSWDKWNRLDVFARGSQDPVTLQYPLWHRAWNGSAWQAWEGLGGNLAAGPGCASWGLNRLDCFGIGSDGESLWHIAWNGSAWSAWENLG